MGVYDKINKNSGQSNHCPNYWYLLQTAIFTLEIRIMDEQKFDLFPFFFLIFDHPFKKFTTNTLTTQINSSESEKIFPQKEII